MKHQRAIAAMATGLVFSLGSAHAATYSVNFFLEDNATLELTTMGGTSTLPFPALQVTGEITTDGTLGALNASNFVSWNFDIGFVGFSESEAFGQGDDPANGYSFAIDNSGLDLFSASATELSVGAGSLQFGASLTQGREVQFVSFGVSNPSDGLTFSATTAQGPISATYSASQLGFTQGVVGTAAAPSPVPVPASMPLVLGGLAAFGMMSRHRKKRT